MADARVSAATVEALTNSAPERRLSALTLEALTNAAPPPERRVSAVAVEVLTPALLVDVAVYLRTAGSTRPVQVKLADASWAPVRVVGP